MAEQERFAALTLTPKNVIDGVLGLFDTDKPTKDAAGKAYSLLSQYVAQQTAAKDHEIAELRQGIDSKMHRDGYGAGILEAVNAVRQQLGDGARYRNSSLLDALESLARQHPQPTTGQDTPDEQDSEHLQQLRECIDANLEWPHATAEEEGDYTRAIEHTKDLVLDLRATVARLEAQRDGAEDMPTPEWFWKVNELVGAKGGTVFDVLNAVRDLQQRIATLERELEAK